ncbi:uncharacterized protein M421DRAFT_7403 [Didymella exigua CBS 183.55]|uniref:Rhodopsin domain-containing protein n=1 Tax=Didymella exigua CBS 183.55 TaxID=1150837 RepID=A0A6A5RF19_9PLEO|nr:uncharacterized protein M421DRAFT_7403 [Didymella exigua CBS 183.55]KAF1925890.1 hypothetical protein M421DRAFT_7403 [Didymella exigua CBS 183.55]
MATNFDQVILSDSNRTPIVQILIWFCLVTSFLAFITHAGIKLYVFRALRAESGFLLASLVFCITQSVAALIQCRYGFGKPVAALSSEDVQSSLKAEYAATVLLFMSLGFSKLAIVAFVHSLTPSKLHRKINYAVGALACLWITCAVLIAVFQCRVPRTWDRTLTHCTDRFIWWNTISILNIVTEVAIIALELGITAHLQVARQKKASIMSLFACRILVPVAAAIQLAYFHQEHSNSATSEDLMLGYWRSALCNQVMQCLAITTTCLPYTKIFMEGFESGLFRVDETRRRGEYASKGHSGREYQLMDVSRSSQAQQSTPDRSINVSKSWAISVEPADRLRNK